MLRAGRLAAGVLGGLLAVLPLAPVAWADGGAECPPDVAECYIDAGSGGTKPGGGPGGTGGGAGGGASAAACVIDGAEVPCQRPGLGWFNPADRCYWARLEPQPAPEDRAWQSATGLPADWKPGQGALYNTTCTAKGAELMGGIAYSAAPPPGQGGAVDPVRLAEQAVEKMALRGADIGTAPRSGTASLIGLPVWLWNTPAPATWGPISAQASAGGVTVTATAHVTRIQWATGDGATVTCTSAGTPYLPEYGTRTPDCGHTYTLPGTYTVTATSTWSVDWTASTGQGGAITTTRASTTTVTLAEAQALNR